MKVLRPHFEYRTAINGYQRINRIKLDYGLIKHSLFEFHYMGALPIRVNLFFVTFRYQRAGDQVVVTMKQERCYR